MNKSIKNILISILNLIKDLITKKPNPPTPIPTPIPPTPVPSPTKVIIVDPIIINPPQPKPPIPPEPLPIPTPKPIPPIPTPNPPQITIKWTNLSIQRNDSNGSWGNFLTDVHNHLPTQYGNQYFDNDRVTHCHETTHGINNHLSNYFTTPEGKKGYGFYVGNNNGIVIEQPTGVTLADVANAIPSNFRGSRYQLYLVQQRKDWNNDPLYLFDEFSAYINGAQTGLEISNVQNFLDYIGINAINKTCYFFDNGFQQKSFPTPYLNKNFSAGSSDVMIGPIEFAAYCLFLTITIKKLNLNYLEKNDQYKAFLDYQLKRAFSIYKKGIVMQDYQWDSPFEENLKNNQEIKDILFYLYGKTINDYFV